MKEFSYYLEMAGKAKKETKEEKQKREQREQMEAIAKAIAKAEENLIPGSSKNFYIFANTPNGRMYIKDFINNIIGSISKNKTPFIKTTPTSLNDFFELDMEKYQQQVKSWFINNWIRDGQKIPKSFYLINNEKANKKKDKKGFTTYSRGEEYINFDEKITPSQFIEILNGIDDSMPVNKILLNFLNGLFIVAEGKNSNEKIQWIDELMGWKKKLRNGK
jgi:hypothetical protein